MPRNSDSVPSVTMSGGNLSRVISTAFSAPPATPSSSVSATATGIGTPTSRQRQPPDLDPQPRDLERVSSRREVVSGHPEHDALDGDDDEQHPLVVGEQS